MKRTQDIKPEENNELRKLYDCNPHRVSNFNPCDYLIEIRVDPLTYEPTNDINNSELSLYLPVDIKKMWFRLCYPKGKIDTKYTQTNDIFVVEATIYSDFSLPDNHYLAKDYSSNLITGNNNVLQKTITSAIGRALNTAGFNIPTLGDIPNTSNKTTDAPMNFMETYPDVDLSKGVQFKPDNKLSNELNELNEETQSIINKNETINTSPTFGTSSALIIEDINLFCNENVSVEDKLKIALDFDITSGVSKGLKIKDLSTKHLQLYVKNANYPFLAECCKFILSQKSESEV